MFVLHHKGDIAAWPITEPLGKIVVRTSWALALARRRRFSCCLPATTLPITPLLGAALLAAAGTGPIPPAGLDPTPPLSRHGTGVTAIPALGIRRCEPSFTALEQTTPCPPAP
jgi:hypothetical protein